jgi:hypothetical protein
MISLMLLPCRECLKVVVTVVTVVTTFLYPYIYPVFRLLNCNHFDFPEWLQWLQVHARFRVKREHSAARTGEILKTSGATRRTWKQGASSAHGVPGRFGLDQWSRRTGWGNFGGNCI